MIIIDLQQYLQSLSAVEEQDFSPIVLELAEAAGTIHWKIQRLGLDADKGSLGKVNVHGEEVQKLDEVATKVFLTALNRSGLVAMVGCEERSNPVLLTKKSAPYVVNMDPIDGSSNIDVAVGIGSIFGIWPRERDTEPVEYSLLLPGRRQVAALYVIYGSNTVLVLATSTGVREFNFDPETGMFMLVNGDVRIPSECQYYSVNHGNWRGFSQSVKDVVAQLQSTYSLRYVGSLVADFHRNLLKGGVFLYPRDAKNPSGKLRLMYEANPLSFVIENAGGLSSSGHEMILDIEPTTLHQRTPLILGSSVVMREIMSKLTNE